MLNTTEKINHNPIKIDDAIEAILRNINPLESEEIQITDALNRVLAEDVYSSTDVPLLDNSAMDGYAVRSADTLEISTDKPKLFHVIGDLRAGFVSKETVLENQAMRIMTGAPVPSGADAVVMQEDTKRENGKGVNILKKADPGMNVRKAGEDIRKGELVIKRGLKLNSACIGVLASLGRPKVSVIRKPKVAILATGDEVIDVDEELSPGKLRSSNTYTLFSQLLSCGCIPKNLGIAHDKPEELEAKIREGLDCDLILTSGGISVGDYDLVKYILLKMGTDIKFWKVAIKPGKPLVFGLINNIPIFGLPGNPVSSMVSFEVFVRPAILKLLAQESDSRREVDAVLEEDIKKKKGLRYFMRAQTRWEESVFLTHTTGPQGSGILRSMAYANSLIVLPEDEEFVQKGTRVTVRFLD